MKEHDRGRARSSIRTEKVHDLEPHSRVGHAGSLQLGTDHGSMVPRAVCAMTAPVRP